MSISRYHAFANVLGVTDSVFTASVGQIVHTITGIGKVEKKIDKLAL